MLIGVLCLPQPGALLGKKGLRHLYFTWNLKKYIKQICLSKLTDRVCQYVKFYQRNNTILMFAYFVEECSCVSSSFLSISHWSSCFATFSSVNRTWHVLHSGAGVLWIVLPLCCIAEQEGVLAGVDTSGDTTVVSQGALVAEGEGGRISGVAWYQGASMAEGEGGRIFGMAWSQGASLAEGEPCTEVERGNTVVGEATCDLVTISLLIPSAITASSTSSRWWYGISSP